MSELVSYGIQNEKSDIRAHVCPLAGRVYVYRTRDGLSVIEKRGGELKTAPAFQRGIKTAEGYLVPPRLIPNMRRVRIPASWIEHYRFSDDDDLSLKGRKATDLVCHMLRSGAFPLWVEAGEVTDHDIQISGMDIYVKASTRIQVKMDYRGGEGDPPVTGNLYLQVAERNPFGIY